MTRLLITSGRGPAECRIALRHILRRMEAEANKAGLPIDISGRTRAALGRRDRRRGWFVRVCQRLDWLGSMDLPVACSSAPQAPELVCRHHPFGRRRQGQHGNLSVRCHV